MKNMDFYNMVGEIVVWPSACCLKDGDLWIMHGKLNILFKYNLKSGDTESVFMPKDEILSCESNMSAVIVVKDNVYLIPRWGRHVHHYNIITKEDRILEIPDEKRMTDKMTFSSAFMFEEKIYCIPEQYLYVIEIDPINDNIRIVYDIKTILMNEGVETVNLGLASTDGKGVIYINILGTNKILILDLVSEGARIIKIGNNDAKYGTLTIIQNYIYMSLLGESKICIYDTSKNETIEYLTIPYVDFGVFRLGNDSVLIDSISDGRYMVLKDGKTYGYKEQPRDYKGEYGYGYHHGIVVCESGVEKKYFNRHTYSLFDIREDGLIDNNSTRLIGKIDLQMFKINDYLMVKEGEIFNLNWFVNELLN